MSAQFEAAQEICSSMELLRQELDYIGKQLDGSDMARRRERIATAALTGIIANPNWNRIALEMAGIPEANQTKAAAFISARYADALLAELDKPVDKPAE